ncbi:MAG TPA: thiamine pyrophosphate-dependent enzyme [Bacteroidales bacterium]|nr:thiamine pyrophosphate-dependent enzyme [Bacteroidales bacterium]
MQKLILLGDEAIAQAAIDAGISGMYAYPGTPSTEIMEYIIASKEAAEKNIHRRWSANEKTALEAALGMSYTGKRVIVAMKHVGLNVAADAFVNSALTGVNGGLIVVAADDPSMHSSQNEQDSRFYARFSLVPLFEPSNQQEAYEMIFDAFNTSEKYRLPVLLRVTTRLAHSRSAIERREEIDQNMLILPEDPRQFVLLPAIARRKYRALLGTYDELMNDSTLVAANKYFEGDNTSLGIIASGIAYNYLRENLPEGKCEYPVVKISGYPYNENLIRKITDSCAEILVLEEGYPIIEELLRGFPAGPLKVNGRLNGTLPRDGELNPNLVAVAVGLSDTFGKPVPSIVKNRPPSLCKGCSHSDMYNALNEVMNQYEPGRVFSDIGCYTLGALPPYNAIYSCVDMGASVTMAIGAADAGLFPSVAVIGDSTFTHSGMTGLLDAVIKDSPVTVIISDNSTTGMTGGQESHATDRLESICKGLGVNEGHIRAINPLRKYHDENVKIINEEVRYRGVSVIISGRECIQTATRKKKLEKKK